MTIDTRDREGRFVDFVEPTVSIVDASGSTRDLGAEHTAPGLYEAEFDIDTYGDYMRLRVESRHDGQPVKLTNYAVVESYPPEYRTATADRAFLEHATEVTSGRREPEPAAAIAFEGDPARGLRDLWRLFVLIAGLLLPIDIALRRIG